MWSHPGQKHDIHGHSVTVLDMDLRTPSVLVGNTKALEGFYIKHGDLDHTMFVKRRRVGRSNECLGIFQSRDSCPEFRIEDLSVTSIRDAPP